MLRLGLKQNPGSMGLWPVRRVPGKFGLCPVPRPRHTTLALICLLAFAPTAPAQSISARVATRDITLGESLLVEVQITNPTQASAPTPKPSDEFAIQLQSLKPNESTSISITNRGRTQTISYTYQFDARPTRAGTLTLPAFKIIDGGKTLRTAPIQINVRADSGAEYLLCDVDAQPPSAYVGQQMTLTLRIWVRKFEQPGLVMDDRELASRLWRRIDTQAGRLGIFSDVDPTRIRFQAASRRAPSGEQTPYYIYLLEKTYYPTAPGPLPLGDISIVFNYPLRAYREVFLDINFDGVRRFNASPTLPDIKILPLPTEGRPPDFNGAVGQYTLRAKAAPTTIPVGDPITLTLTIEGDGPLDRLSAPKLAQVPALTASFEIAGESLAGNVEGARKIFSQTIRPLREDVREIPAIPLSFFNPKSARYETAWSDPIPLQVKPAARLAAGDIAAASIQSSTLLPLEESGAGILANYVDPAALLADRTPSLGPLSYALLLLMPALYALTAFIQRRSNRLRRDDAYRRRLHALPRAKSALQKAASPADLESTLLTFIADRHNAPAASLTRAEAMRLLADHAAPADFTRRLDEYLATLEQSRYGGGASANLDPDIARRWIDEMERLKLP